MHVMLRQEPQALTLMMTLVCQHRETCRYNKATDSLQQSRSTCSLQALLKTGGPPVAALLTTRCLASSPKRCIQAW